MVGNFNVHSLHFSFVFLCVSLFFLYYLCPVQNKEIIGWYEAAFSTMFAGWGGKKFSVGFRWGD